MSVERVLEERKAELSGHRIAADEAALLAAGVTTPLPSRLTRWMLDYPLCGTGFSLGEEEDESGLGVDMQWLTPAQMISEAVEAIPASSQCRPATCPSACA